MKTTEGSTMQTVVPPASFKGSAGNADHADVFRARGLGISPFAGKRSRKSPMARASHIAQTAGSWMRATHPEIQFDDVDQARDPISESMNPRRTYVFGAAAMSLLIILASSNLIDVYGSLSLWLLAALSATALATCIAAAGRLSRMSGWWQLVCLVISQYVLGPIVCLNETTIAHLMPTISTLSQGFSGSLESFKYLIAVQPPLGYVQGALMAVWTSCLWLGFLAVTLAMNPTRIINVLSLVPLMALFSVSALLGTATGSLPVLRGLLIGAIALVWLSWRWEFLELQRWFSSLVMVFLALLMTAGACWLIPQDRTIMREHYQPPISPYDYSSPLSSMRSYIKNHKEDTLLTVTGLPPGTTVRLAAMDSFDGNVWNLSDSSQASDSSDYRQVGASMPNASSGRRFKAKFIIGKGMKDNWLPLSGSVSSINFDKVGPAGSFYHHASTNSAIIPSQTQPGMTYEETGILPDLPSNEQISHAQADPLDQPRTQDVPDAVSRLASAMAGGAGSGGASALALTNKLKETGWFSHGLSGDYPSQPGHGNFRISAFLADSQMVGDSEQYASAMGLMARELGLPSRVVLGFIPKDKEGKISKARTQKLANASTKTKFTGNDVEAWVEIRLKDYGWVPFYPTPKETKIPDNNQNMTPPNPQTLVRQPPVPLTDPPHDDEQAREQSALAGQDAKESGNAFWSRVFRITGQVVVYGSPLWILLLLCSLILGIKAVQLYGLKNRGTPSQRINNGWTHLTHLARQSGFSVEGTRKEEAQSMSKQFGVASTKLLPLSRQADYTAFSGQIISEQSANRYWKSIDGIHHAILSSQPWFKRICAHLSIKGMFTPMNASKVGSWRNDTYHMIAWKHRVRTILPSIQPVERWRKWRN